MKRGAGIPPQFPVKFALGKRAANCAAVFSAVAKQQHASLRGMKRPHAAKGLFFAALWRRTAHTSMRAAPGRDAMRKESICAAAMAASLFVASCSTTAPDGISGAGAEPRWQANGYLSPWRNDNPDVIGQFVDRKSCVAAAEGWKSRQVVGNPIFAECLPIDTH